MKRYMAMEQSPSWQYSLSMSDGSTVLFLLRKVRTKLRLSLCLPEVYIILAGKERLTLGGWFLLQSVFYMPRPRRKLRPRPFLPQLGYVLARKEHPVIIMVALSCFCSIQVEEGTTQTVPSTMDNVFARKEREVVLRVALSC